MTSYLLIGHVAEDLYPAGSIFGGTVLYAAHVSVGLGCETRVVTSVKEDGALTVPGAQVSVVESDTNTTFRHITVDGHRRSWLFNVASTIHAVDIPPAWRTSNIWHLGPIAGEIGHDVLDVIPAGAFVGVTPQGWLREVTPDFRVSPRDWTDAGPVLSRANAVVISLEDLPDAPVVGQRWSLQGPVVAVTAGSAGSTLYVNGSPVSVPSFSVRVVDEIGAGDVYAVALFYRLAAGDAPAVAGRFASAAAAIAVTGRGPDQLPDRAQIDTFLLDRIS